MAMTTRERIGEYAVLKTLGYSGLQIATLIMGESLVITFAGMPARHCPDISCSKVLQQRRWRPIFLCSTWSPPQSCFDFGAALIVGVIAAANPHQAGHCHPHCRRPEEDRLDGSAALVQLPQSLDQEAHHLPDRLGHGTGGLCLCRHTHAGRRPAEDTGGRPAHTTT